MKENVKFKNFRMPFEDVPLTKLEVIITQTAIFQRLFNLRQLGFAHLVYPAATHTRATHSIRCLAFAIKILDSLKKTPDNESDYYAIRLAALLHDIGHGPFSHTIEDENDVFSLGSDDNAKQHKHDGKIKLDTLKVILLKQIEDKLHDNDKDLIDRSFKILIDISEDNSDWKGDMIGNTICADLLAYIDDDTSQTGLEKRPDYHRLYQVFDTKAIKTNVMNATGKKRFCTIITKDGGLRQDVISSILDILDMRYALYERVIFHHAKCVASSMLARAVRLSGISIDDPIFLNSGEERFLVELPKMVEDDEIRTAVSLLVDSLNRRKLFKRIYKISSYDWQNTDAVKRFSKEWRNPDNIDKLLNSIESKRHLPKGSLALWCNPHKNGMKLVKAQVVWDDGGTQVGPYQLRSDEFKEKFPMVWKRIDNIEEQYRNLWTVWVSIHPAEISKVFHVIADLEEALQKKCNKDFFNVLSTTSCSKYYETYKPVKKTMLDQVEMVEDLAKVKAASDGITDRPPEENHILNAMKTVAEKKLSSKDGELQLGDV